MVHHKVIHFYSFFAIFALLLVILHFYVITTGGYSLRETGLGGDSPSDALRLPAVALVLIIGLVFILHRLKPRPFRGTRIPLRNVKVVRDQI